MDDDDGRYLVSLAELKLLGEFVRWQDIDNRLAELSRERLAPRAYPRFKCRFQPDIWIDVLVDSRWRKVEFVSLASDELRYLDQGREFTLRVTEYNTAPAGYFTDYFDESLQVNEVELLDSFKYPFPALSASFYVETQSAALNDVFAPYVTIHAKCYSPDKWWPNGNVRSAREIGTREFTLHVRDPRLKINGAKNRQPLYNHKLAISHRWLTASHPDPEGVQFRELVAISDQLSLHDCQVLAFDYCALPQRPRTSDEELLFSKLLPKFQRHFSRHTIVLKEGSHDYRSRGWCMLELLQAAMNDAIVNPDVLKDDLGAAYKLAQGFVESADWNRINVQDVSYDPAGILASIEYSGIYNQALAMRKKIFDMFESELEITEEEDRALILEQLKEQCNLMRPRTVVWND